VTGLSAAVVTTVSTDCRLSSDWRPLLRGLRHFVTETTVASSSSSSSIAGARIRQYMYSGGNELPLLYCRQPAVPSFNVPPLVATFQPNHRQRGQPAIHVLPIKTAEVLPFHTLNAVRKSSINPYSVRSRSVRCVQTRTVEFKGRITHI